MRTYLLFLIAMLFSVVVVKGQTTKTIGGAGADFATLKAAFDAINAGTVTGDIALQITGSTTEAATAQLNASGSGSASYSSVIIYPTGPGYSISGNLATALVDFNGANKVTIDGRVNATGSSPDLTIMNLSTSGVSNTTTITLISSAAYNAIKYANIKGGATGIYSGVILFSQSSSGIGNSNNIVDHCNLTSINASSRPYYVIYSYGTSGHENKNNTISNNNIYDFLSTALSSSYGININVSSTDWVITGNSLYETTTFQPGGNNSYFGIKINNTSGNNFLISGNYIGGNAPLCAGKWIVSANFSYRFYCIHIDAGTTTPSSVQNNTITNFSCLGGSDIPWMGMDIDAGSVNVGTVTGNTIGDSNSTGSISLSAPVASASLTLSGGAIENNVVINNGGSGYTSVPIVTFTGNGTGATGTATISNGVVTGVNVTNGGSGYTYAGVTFNSSVSASTSYGIYVQSSGTVNVANNSIGSVTTSSTTSYSHGFFGISKQATAGTTTITNNMVGSLTTVKSIQANSASTSSTAQNVYGIISFGSGSTTISNNTIVYLFNDYAYQYSTNGQVGGINAINGTNTIQNNTVRDLSTTAQSNDPNGNAAVIGIAQKSASAGQMVTGNTIYNLSCTYTGSRPSSAIGIFYSGGTTAPNIVSGNFIYGFSVASTASTSTPAILSGIKLSTGSTSVYNNIVTLGSGITNGCNISGIYENGVSGNNNNLWFNSVYIGGGPTGVTANTYGLFSNANTNTRDFRNNIFYNARSGGASGKHYAIYLAGTTNLTEDYNDYFANGTNGVLGNLASADKTSLNAWQTATGKDVYSLNIDPVYALAGGNLAVNYYTTATLPGVNGTGISTDYDALTRAQTPKIGALEVNNFTWAGTTSTDFNTGSNWTSGTVPNDGANISFAATPSNNCVLDKDRILGNITNAQSAKSLVLNGHHLTIQGNLNLSNNAQIDATVVSSAIVFAGTTAQSIPSGGFASNSVISLTVNNSAGVTQNGNLTITGSLTLTSGTFTVGANTLTVSASSVTSAGGNIDASNGGSTLIFANSTAITLPAAIFLQPVNNLTINGSGGITSGGNFTVNGVLNLQSANASATQGCLEMGSNTLTMGGTATTTGTGDVTGIVSRSSFVAGRPYSFGNQFTTLNMSAGGTLPSSISAKITLISSPLSWLTNGIKRVYNFIQTGGNDLTLTTMDLHYLPSELYGTSTEGSLDVFDNDERGSEDHGASNYSTTNMWVGLANIPISYIAFSSSDFTKNSWSLGKSTLSGVTWVGITSTDWTNSTNWAGGSAPTATSNVIIPPVVSPKFQPTLPASTTINSLTIQSGGVLNGGTGTSLTIAGSTGAWINLAGEPGFNAGTSTIVFTSPSATMADPTNFYNVTVANGATLMLGTNNIMRIAGALSLSNTGVLNAANNSNTIEYNGNNQTIINPNGSIPGYYYLILSGSGTKTMPGSALTILGDLTIAGTASVTAASPLAIRGNLTIGSGSYFISGALSHTLGGDFLNSGNFTATSGSTITANGSSDQTISGSAAFDNLNVNSNSGVSLLSDVTVNSRLTLSLGNLNIGANTLTINGDIAQVNGTLTGGTSSNITFGGSGLPATLPAVTLNNLIINRTGGIDLGGAVIVNGTLGLTAGILTVGSNTLTISGNSPSRTTGSIDASNSAATIIFANPAAIILPSAIFSQAVNNLTINGAGGVSSSGSFTINGVLYLPAPNASSTKGSLDMEGNTLSMGPEATTTGTGDVTGTLSRSMIEASTTYSFGNQNSTINFASSGTLPTSLSVLISIGTAPVWKPGAILRQYIMTYTGSAPTAKATIRMHYLDDELNGNTDGYLSYWTNLPAVADQGRSDYDLTNDIVTISNITFSFTSGTSFSLANSSQPFYTWSGSTSTDWNTGSNWIGNSVPSSTSDVVIPNTAAINQPSLPSVTEIKTINIQTGGVLNAVSGASLTVNGSSGTWNNDGTFNPSNSTVIFSNGTDATVSGTTNFNNITISSGTNLINESGSVIGIAGIVTNNGFWSTISQGPTTVNYNGGSQTVIVPDRSTNSYSTLVLSGTGAKTMPVTPLTITGDFLVSGTATAVAGNPMVITGNTDIGTGSSFTTGSYNHSMSDLTIEQGGTLTISGSGSLIVTGLITNNAGIPGLVIKSTSDAAGSTGALFNDNSNALATVERWMTGDIWHLISPTATSSTKPTIADFAGDSGNLIAYAGSVYGLAPYVERNDTWSYYAYPSPSGSFNTPGTGYEVLRGPTAADGSGTHTGYNGVVSFKGTLSSSAVVTPITKSGNGWNLIGNPFPCALNVSDFLTDPENMASINSNYLAIYVRDLSPAGILSGGYIPINHLNNLMLSSGEGFFVKAAASGSINFATSMKSSSSEAFKSTAINYPGINLTAQSGTQTLSTSVFYIAGMTTGLDPGWDAGIFNGNNSSFSLFTRLVKDNGIDFAVQCLPDNSYETLIVPVGLVAAKGTTVNFKAGVSNFPSNLKVYLEDRNAAIFTRLDNGGNYSVTLSTDSLVFGRFYLHSTTKDLSVLPVVLSTDLQVIPMPQSEIIRVLGSVSLPAVASVYDITGKTITIMSMTGTDQNDIPLANAPSGIYVLKIQSKATPLTKKIRWVR